MLRKLVFGLALVALSGWFLYAAPSPADSKNDADMLAQVRATLKLLDSNDDRSAASRINLAKVAIANKAYAAAREALDAALRLEPQNVEASQLMQQVLRNLPATPPPTTSPAVATTSPAQPLNKPPAGNSFVVTREVTPAEINHIRQVEWKLEWKPDESTKMVLRVDPEARKKFVAANTDYTLASLSKLTPEEQAKLLLEQGKEDVRNGVQLMKDPDSVAEFKKSCRFVITTCGAVGCHAAPVKGNSFVLYTPPTNDAAVYTDFLSLLKSSFTIKDAERLMVDRATPDSSLLLQFLLPADIADVPHPTAPGFRPPVKAKADPRYQLVLNWIQSLSPLPQNYGVDLSKGAPVAAPVK